MEDRSISIAKEALRRAERLRRKEIEKDDYIDKTVGAGEPMPERRLTVREAAAKRMTLDGSDAQALEGALRQAEKELEIVSKAFLNLLGEKP